MAKSPVFGCGRNFKRRWQGKKTAAPHHPAAANINMHGKKYKSMSCGCCYCLDLRDKMLHSIHTKEIHSYKYN